MLPPGQIICLRVFVTLALTLAGMAFGANRVCAQEQERKLLDRIQHPNMDLHAQGFEKSFETKASNRDQQAAVHPFLYGGRTAGTKTGDGMFHTRSYDDGRGSFRTDNFTVKRAAAADRQALAQADRTYATSPLSVREDRAAGKLANTRDYVNSTKPYLVPGKRQDTIDDLRRQPNLSVDQVREILNKSR